MLVVTFNLQHGEPLTGDARSAQHLAAAARDVPGDVIALQEVDKGQARSGRVDQTAVLAETLGFRWHRFAAAFGGSVRGLRRRPVPAHVPGGAGYGVALLSRWPVVSWHVRPLRGGPVRVSRAGSRPWVRVRVDPPRVLLAAVVQAPDGPVAVGCTHLSTDPPTARRQLAESARALRTLPGPHLLLGDLNLGPDDAARAALNVLLSPAYAAERRALIGESASAELRPGVVPGREPFRPPLRETDDAHAAGVGEPTVTADGEQRGDTCHVDVVDRWGNMVSATPSGGWLQSSPTVPELGFCLGTRLQMTWLEDGASSSLEPGRRPRTTLTPTLVLRDGHAVTALGSPGGDQQDQWQLLYLLRTIVGGYSPQEAIDAPAFHTRSMPDSFWPRTWAPARAVVEDRLGAGVIAELERRGHRVTRAGDWSLGRLSAVTRDPATGLLGAAANPRGMQGYAAGR